MPRRITTRFPNSVRLPAGLVPLAALVITLVTMAGCGPSYPETAPVTGKVTLDGQPLSTGKIVFYPKEGRPAMGQIEPDGTYTLTTFEEGDGALPGEHKVTIKATEVVGGQMPKSFEEEVALGTKGGPTMSPGELKWLAPSKYAQRETSPLAATVTLEGENQIDFELKPE